MATGKLIELAFDEESKYHFLFLNFDSTLFKMISRQVA
jgi:hypothetical protein